MKHKFLPGLKIKLLGSLVLAILGAHSAQAQTIISAGNFVSGASAQNIDGTTLGITVNQPGSAWIFGAGWSWAQPQIPNTLGGPTANGGIPNTLSSIEERTAVGLSLISTGAYVKPSEFTISAQLTFYGSTGNNGGAGLGFWAAMPARDNAVVATTGFTGFMLSQSASDDTIQFYLNGTATGSAITLGLDLVKQTPFTLGYTVNTVTGTFSNVTLDGNAIAITGTGITDANTSFGGVAGGLGSRFALDEFVVAAVPEPGSGFLLMGILVLTALRRRRSA